MRVEDAYVPRTVREALSLYDKGEPLPVPNWTLRNNGARGAVMADLLLKTMRSIKEQDLSAGACDRKMSDLMAYVEGLGPPAKLRQMAAAEISDDVSDIMFSALWRVKPRDAEREAEVKRLWVEADVDACDFFDCVMCGLHAGAIGYREMLRGVGQEMLRQIEGDRGKWIPFTLMQRKVGRGVRPE